MAEAMPTFLNDGRTTTLFLFNHIISRFGVPHAIVTDHGAHFKNQMMSELHVKLGFRHENSSPYYPQANGQVEAINKVLKTHDPTHGGENKTSWHLQLFSALWAYRTSAKTSTGFTPFQLVYGIEAVLPIECEIPSLKLKVELLPHTSAKKNDSCTCPNWTKHDVMLPSSMRHIRNESKVNMTNPFNLEPLQKVT
jgi:hypothetical protein